ncbi:hypothetical protein A2W39_01335 [Candidatus Azambacteria bacterium RIFCSPHIGHO2_01_46_10]|uniref:Vitamin K epoxide reductase domain-containing protein n=1 Tax=Candidatus Azambacteria bacterium RIFCSPHIGHO2_01_46_10 TaxID=1797293 RepID=A0A1F5BWV2_9BACT|nr:MAG: hypothetical protein A2W39_01335 [Candidatus Azambacteria bacterium RIFCSPHIGHO2_01_46_10]
MSLKNKKIFIFAIMTVAFLGILDTGYLAYEHFSGVVPPCTINGCERVLTSEYAVIFGVPLGLWGLAFYSSVLTLAVLSYFWESRKTFLILLSTTAIGFLMSLGFVYIQLFVLKAICMYCMISAATATALFALTLYLFIILRKFQPRH